MAQLLRANVVFGGADHSSSNSQCCAPRSQANGGIPVALYSYLLGASTSPLFPGIGTHLRDASHRLLRHDRSRLVADRLQSAAATYAQTGVRGPPVALDVGIM